MATRTRKQRERQELLSYRAKAGRVLSARLSQDDVGWITDYEARVRETFTAIFQLAGDRFPDWTRLMRRFIETVGTVLKHGRSRFRAVEEAHNELCIAAAILSNESIRFVRLEYEPPLHGCAQSIDFRATAERGLTLFVDVKTIKPEARDRWDQYQRALYERWFPPNVHVIVEKEWLGGELWHNMFAARSRMLEYTLELEKKIADGGLTGQEETFFFLALCGTGFHWRESQLEDFVEFYRTGVHRTGDSFSKVEIKHIEKNNLSFDRTISRFACMRRSQNDIHLKSVNWNV